MSNDTSLARVMIDSWWPEVETEKTAAAVTPSPPAAGPDNTHEHAIEIANFAKEAGAVIAARLGQPLPAAVAEPAPSGPTSSALDFLQQKLAASGYSAPQGGVAPERTDAPGQAHFPGVQAQLGTTEAAMDFTRRDAKAHQAKELQQLIGQSPAKEPDVRRFLTTTPEQGGLKYGAGVALVRQLLGKEA